MNVRQWKVFQAAKQKWSKFDYELKVIVIVCLVALGAWLFASAARAEDTGSGQTLREFECAIRLGDHAIIRDARIDGHEKDTVKSWVKPDYPGKESIFALIDEAYDAINVDAWYAGYMIRCMGGKKDASHVPDKPQVSEGWWDRPWETEGYGLPFVRTASSQALVSPSLMQGYTCYARTDFARRAIYAVRRSLEMPTIPGHWSEAEQARLNAIFVEAIVWPRGEIDFVEYVGRECIK